MRLHLLLLAALLTCANMAAQQGPYTISGTVVSTTTGQPLDRADVSLLAGDSEQGQPIAETTTNADGRFTFTHLAAAKYSLHADRPGYLAAAYDEHDGFSTSIVTGEGLISDGLIFRLAPYAVIAGTITDDSGDPVQQAKVSLFRQDVHSGSSKIIRASSAITDDTGAYEFARLEPGNYFLSVTATPWYATRPFPKFDEQSNPLPDATHASLDVAYPMTFYADVTDENAATPIPVKAGDRIPVNFTLHAVPAIHLTFKLPVTPGHPWNMPQLHQEAFGSSDILASLSVSTTGNVKNGTLTVETSGIAPGQYEASMSPSRNAERSSRAATIDATGDTTLDVSQMTTQADVSGKVALADGGKLPDHVNISLQSLDGESSVSEHTDADGNFTLHGVEPGNYEVHVSGTGKALSIAKISASGAPFDGHALKVGSQPVTIAATLLEGSATISGFAKQNGKPASGVMLLLAPNHPKTNSDLFRRAQSNSDGSFELHQVVPGSYTLVAIEDGWTLDWARPEAIAHYLAQGQPVTVPPHTREIPLKDAIEAQPK